MAVSILYQSNRFGLQGVPRHGFAIKVVYIESIELQKIISKYGTIVVFGVKIDIWGFGYFTRYFGLEQLSQKRVL